MIEYWHNTKEDMVWAVILAVGWYELLIKQLEDLGEL